MGNLHKAMNETRGAGAMEVVQANGYEGSAVRAKGGRPVLRVANGQAIHPLGRPETDPSFAIGVQSFGAIRDGR